MNHRHVILTAHNLDAPPRQAEDIISWLNTMVDAIGMKVLMGPYATRCDTEGNEGVTGIVVIETSHISVHCWDTVEKPFLTADIYSCQDFDCQIVLNMFAFFMPDYVDYMLIDRNEHLGHSNKVIENGTQQFSAPIG